MTSYPETLTVKKLIKIRFTYKDITYFLKTIYILYISSSEIAKARVNVALTLQQRTFWVSQTSKCSNWTCSQSPCNYRVIPIQYITFSSWVLHWRISFSKVSLAESTVPADTSLVRSIIMNMRAFANGSWCSITHFKGIVFIRNATEVQLR
jgi:hypothetical protein